MIAMLARPQRSLDRLSQEPLIAEASRWTPVPPPYQPGPPLPPRNSVGPYRLPKARLYKAAECPIHDSPIVMSGVRISGIRYSSITERRDLYHIQNDREPPLGFNLVRDRIHQRGLSPKCSKNP